MSDTLRHWIAGKAVASEDGRTFDNINPATHTLISPVSRGDRQDVERAVTAAVAARSGPWG